MRIRAIPRLTLAIVIMLALTLGFYCFVSAPAQALSEQQIAAALQDTAACLVEANPAPQPGSSGGEWLIMGLSRGGYPAPAGYYDSYYASLEQYLRANQGVLDSRKYSEYSRTILALTALGRDPTQVAGYDLTLPLSDFQQTIWQGVNGAISALLALESGDYGSEALRGQYRDYILASQLADGGWSLSGTSADPDLTAMALQALAPHQSEAAVKSAVARAISCLSLLQQTDAGFISYGAAGCESTAQVIVALAELGLPADDSRFVKGGRTLTDNLLGYYRQGQGFSHLPGGEADQMASEQALYAMVALTRQS